MRYRFGLYKSSVITGPPDTFIEEVTRSGTGVASYGSSNTKISSVIGYSGNLTIGRVLTTGRYHIIPFVDQINISATVTEAGGGCSCPPFGTFAYYGDCITNQEIWNYYGTCDNSTGYQYNGCDIYLTYGGLCV